MIIILSIILLFSLLAIIGYFYYNKENINNIGDLPRDLLGFPGRYFKALKSAFDDLKLYIGYIPIGHERCASGYTEFPLTCTKGCGGFYNESWGAVNCNGPKVKPACNNTVFGPVCTGWNDCYKTWIVDCFRQPAHTYNRRALCRGDDEEKSGLCYPKGYL